MKNKFLYSHFNTFLPKMSSNSTGPSLPVSPKQKTMIIGVSLLCGAIIIVAVVSYFYGKQEGSKNLSAVPLVSVTSSPYQRVLGAQTSSWEGKIISVDTTKIVFSPTSGRLKGKKLTSVITDGTQLMRWDLSQAQDNGQPSGNRTPITINEFKPGATVYVQAAVNDENQTEFNAIAVSLLIKPTTN